MDGSMEKCAKNQSLTIQFLQKVLGMRIVTAGEKTAMVGFYLEWLQEAEKILLGVN